jgi:hypothetical protein
MSYFTSPVNEKDLLFDETLFYNACQNLLMCPGFINLKRGSDAEFFLKKGM